MPRTEVRSVPEIRAPPQTWGTEIPVTPALPLMTAASMPPNTQKHPIYLGCYSKEAPAIGSYSYL